MPTATPTERKGPRVAGEEAPAFTRGSFAEPDYSYAAQLVENQKVYTGEQFNEKHDIPEPGLLSWHQKFNRPDRVFEDGNPAPVYNDNLLQWFDGSPVRQGSVADQLAQAFEEICGCDMLPDTPGAEDFVGHWFRLEDRRVGEREQPDGSTKGVYVPFPVEYLGPEFEYTGNPRVVGNQDSKNKKGGKGKAKAQDVDDSPVAETLQSLFNGMTIDDGLPKAAISKVNSTPDLKGVATVFGQNIRGGLTARPGKLPLTIQKLIDTGYLAVEEDQLVAN